MSAALERVGEASHRARDGWRLASMKGLLTVAIIYLSLGTYSKGVEAWINVFGTVGGRWKEVIVAAKVGTRLTGGCPERT